MTPTHSIAGWPFLELMLNSQIPLGDFLTWTEQHQIVRGKGANGAALSVHLPAGT